MVTGTQSGTDILSAYSVEQSTTDSSQHFFAVADKGGSNTTNFGVTGHFPIAGVLQHLSTESISQAQIQTAGTVSDLAVDIAANTLNGAATYTLRNNASDTALAVSIASGTGTFTDTTHTATIASGDEVCFRIVTGGTSGNIQPFSIVSLMTVSAPTPPPTAVVFTTFGDPDFQWLGGDGDMGSF